MGMTAYFALHFVMGAACGAAFAFLRRMGNRNVAVSLVVYAVAMAIVLAAAAAVGSVNRAPGITDAHRIAGTVLIAVGAIGVAYAGLRWRR